MQINRLGEQIGAEILDLDVKNLKQQDFAKIYQTWLDCNVIALRDQDLEIEDFLAYSERFGRIHSHPSKSTRHPDYPQVTLLGVNKFAADGKLIQAIYARGGDGWHTDGAYDDEPFKATQLYALAIPSEGGDTLFASMYAACDALPAALKEKLQGKRGAFRYGGRSGQNVLLNPEDRDDPAAMHCLIRRHEETGRDALYFDPGKIMSIEGLDESESNDVIDELTELMIQPGAEYRHEWRTGDIVIWDNRCSYHMAAGDYPPEQDRIHWRVSIKS